MSDIHQLFNGVQSIHGHNYTHTTREGYAYIDDIEDLPEIQYDPNVVEYYNLNPGLYKININGTMYALMIHDTISGSNRLIIENPNNVFTLMGLTEHRVPLYVLHDGTIIENKGILLDHSVNDALDLFIVDGITKRKVLDDKVSMKYPSEFQFMSMLDIRVSTDTIQDDYLFNMKNYLKGIYYDRKHKVCDTMYLDRAVNRALFIFRTARLILTGYEKYEEVEEYESLEVGVYKLVNPLCKSGGLIQCSHLPVIKWEQMTDPTFLFQGICMAPSDSGERAVYFKLPKFLYPNMQSFIDDIMRWYKADKEHEREVKWGQAREEAKARGINPDSILLHSIEACPVTILYELATPQYSHLTLDNYDINTYFNKCWIDVYPYRPQGKYNTEFINDLIGLEPKNGVMKTIAQQLEESDDPSKYTQIISYNNIWRDILIDGVFDEDKDFDVDDPDFVAVIPKNGVIKSVAEQLQESGYSSMYSRILAENIIWRNIIVTGDLNIRAMYFYKHLKLDR